jgi:hypothetical protein
MPPTNPNRPKYIGALFPLIKKHGGADYLLSREVGKYTEFVMYAAI